MSYCSRDSRYFVYARRNPALKTNRTEFMRVELGSWKQQRLDTAISISGCAISHDGVFYYLKQADDGSPLGGTNSVVDSVLPAVTEADCVRHSECYTASNSRCEYTCSMRSRISSAISAGGSPAKPTASSCSARRYFSQFKASEAALR